MRKQRIEQLLKQDYSLIPIEKESNKKSAVFWKRYQYNRATLKDIEKWHEQFGDTNMAIVTGKVSNIAVIDVDDKKQLFVLLERIPDLLDTCTVETKRGYHFYFSLNGEHIKSTNKLFGLDNVELRAERRYVMAPGSVINGKEYIFLKPFSCIKPLPKIIIEKYQISYDRTASESEDKQGKETKDTDEEIQLPRFHSKAKCIGQILRYDIPIHFRKLSYHIAYSKLLEEGNEAEYSKKIVKMANKRISKPLLDKELDDLKDKKRYHYGCSRINKELSFVDCSECQVRGGFKMQSLAMKNIHKLQDLTTTEKAILLLLDSYYRGEEPSNNELQKKTGMNFYAVKKAMKGLKDKGVIE